MQYNASDFKKIEDLAASFSCGTVFSLYCNRLRTLKRKGTKQKLATDWLREKYFDEADSKTYLQDPQVQMRRYYCFKSVQQSEDCLLY